MRELIRMDDITEDNDFDLKPEQGAIIIGDEGVFVLVPAEPSPELPPEEADIVFNRVVDTMTYILYALDRDDWLEEFTKIAQDQITKDSQKEKEQEEEEKRKKRSHLKVVK